MAAEQAKASVTAGSRPPTTTSSTRGTCAMPCSPGLCLPEGRAPAQRPPGLCLAEGRAPAQRPPGPTGILP
jgi:hypothetical protein